MRLAALAAILVALFVVRSAQGEPYPLPPDERPPTQTQTTQTVVVVQSDSFLLASLRARVRQEHARYLAAHRRVRQLTRTLQHRETTREALDLACIVYGSCATLWRRAQCESHLYPLAKNASGASGLFQFLPSTFASTPFGRLSVFSPYANALAAGWMQAHGRGGEWVCR